MKRLSLHTTISLAIDIALLTLCLFHIPSLLNRPRSPFEVSNNDDRITVQEILDTSASDNLAIGDELILWNGHRLATEHDIEFLADFSGIGDAVQLVSKRNEVQRTATVRLIACYNFVYVMIVFFVGIVAWCVGVFVLIRRPNELAATLLHWSMVTMGVVVIITWGQTSPNSYWMYISRSLFFIAYASVAATFFHFTLLFPRPARVSFPHRSVIVYLPMALLTCAMIFYHVNALREQSLQTLGIFQTLFDIFHIAVLVYVAAGILHFMRSYFLSPSSEERKKLKWLLWGLTIGPTPFFVLTIIPQNYLPFGFVPEEYTLIFLAIIPIAFGISFVKYHLLDIEVVVNRTTVYGIVLGFVTLLYMMLVGTAAALVGSQTVATSAVAAVIVALLFEPVRRRVQLFVDRQFFRVRYNFREALHRFSDDIKMCADPIQLSEMMILRTLEIIPVERIAVFLLRQSGNRLVALAHKGFDVLARRSLRFETENLRTQLQLPVAIDAVVESGVVHESADERMFNRWKLSLVFPMKSAAGSVIGFFVLGEKRSQQRFSLEDVDLLSSVATQAGLEFERIALQRKLIEEQAEKQRLSELNQLKSDFVSYVSHELKTPLTSIKLFTELLTQRLHARDRKSQEYVEVIEGETDRLNRMVTTILDSARIDKGVKHYVFKDANLAEITSEVMTTMNYQLRKNRFKVSYVGRRLALPISADCDAVAEAIMNLISNAIKYSCETKVLKVTLGRHDVFCFCCVEDRGRGISSEAIPHLFEKFYRDPTSRSRIEGVGLGLSVVKHIMDAHCGRVEVHSMPSEGSAFTLLFPLRKNHEETRKSSRRRR